MTGRPLVYLIACTLDGRIAAPDGSYDFFPFEGPQVADLLDEFPEMIPGHGREQFGITGPNRRFDTVLMGRRTWEVGLEFGITSPYPHLRQIVVSRTLAESPDPAVELIREDVVERVRALKREPGTEIWLCGAAGLAATLIDEIDEVILKVCPVVLGDGIGLFAGDVGPRTVEVAGLRTYPNGFSLLRGRLAPR
jgi:dihydrofolate reductase